MKTRLFWADADSGLTDVFARFFGQFDFDVRTTSTAHDCVQELRDFQPDVAVLDVDLAWGGARGLLEELCGNGSTLRPRIVLVTGGEPAEVLAMRTGQPLAHCLPKPFRLATVLDRIRATLDASRDCGADAACCDV
jgi:DNA-binding response OmpR family regulator